MKIAIAAVLVLLLVFSGAAAASGDGTVDSPYEITTPANLTSFLTNAAGWAEQYGKITVAEIQLTSEITISSNKNLNLNGTVIKAAYGNRAFTVASGASFNLTDTSSGVLHNFTVNLGSPWTLVTGEASKTLADIIADPSLLVNGLVVSIPGGVITGGSASYGGGVYVRDDGMFTMSGTASITGNSASDHGGGVYVTGTNSKFTMSGGSITGNSASYGGGVWSDGTFTMSGSAKIIGNSATGIGGGVYVWDDGTFEMSGDAKITGNSAIGSGGGGVVNYGTFKMSGGNITGNTASSDYSFYGGGVFNSGGTFEMSGTASITENSVSGDGGGVWSDGTFTMSGSAKIIGNSANSGGGVHNEGTFEMSGNAKITENSANSGGGVHNEGTFKVKDAPVISDNTKSDKTTVNNVNLYRTVITLVGALEDVAYIGIINPLGENALFGENDGIYTISDDDAACFHPDNGKLKAKTDGKTLRWGSETPTPAPSSPSSSSRSYGASIWLTATPTPTPTASATPEPTLAQPTASPVKPTPQASTPVPLVGIIAGLGAALVFGLRRK